jgi:hypothetical protein
MFEAVSTVLGVTISALAISGCCGLSLWRPPHREGQSGCYLGSASLLGNDRRPGTVGSALVSPGVAADG